MLPPSPETALPAAVADPYIFSLTDILRRAQAKKPGQLTIFQHFMLFTGGFLYPVAPDHVPAAILPNCFLP